MMWLQYITFIGIVGIAYGNIFCFLMTISNCGLTADLCRPGRNIINCASDTAKICGVEDDDDVKDLILFYEEMCSSGSELNKKYTQHSKCNPKNENCQTGYMKALQEMTEKAEPSDSLKETAKLFCKFKEELSSCQGETVKEICGYGAFIWHKEQQTLNDRLQERACDEVNGAGANSVRLTMWLLQAAFLAFTFKWLSC